MLALVAGPVLTMTLHGAVLNGMHPTRAVALEVARCAVTALGLLWFLQVCARMPASPPPPSLEKCLPRMRSYRLPARCRRGRSRARGCAMRRS